MDRAAIYARYSSDKQKPESIEQQERVCRDYCARMGYEVARVYSDAASSGRSDDRPQFQLMVSDAGQYDVVVVYKLDRFARNRYDSANYKRRLKDAGCRLESATEATGDGIESVLLESLLEGMAEYYSRQLAQNTTRGMTDNAKRCKVNGMVPYGYRNEGGYYAIDEDEAAVVRQIFELYAAGVPRIEDRLTHLKPRRGDRFTQRAISQIVRNERYLGVYQWGDVRIDGGIPRIVSDELWDAAQARMRRRTRRMAHSEMVLHGILYGLDGEPAKSQGTTRRGKVYQYYVVDGRYEEARSIERQVADAIREAVLRPDAMRAAVDGVLRAQEAEGADSVKAALEANIDALERERANYVAAIAAMGAEPSILAEIRKRDAMIRDAQRELDAHNAKSRLVMDADMVAFAIEMMAAEEDDAALIRHFATLAVCTDSELGVWCRWDRAPMTRAEIDASLADFRSGSEESNWCPSCVFLRNGFVVVRRK